MRKLFKKIWELFSKKPAHMTEIQKDNIKPYRNSYQEYRNMNGRTWMITDIDSKYHMRYVTVFNYNTIILANCTEPQVMEWWSFIYNLIDQEKVREIKLEENPWIFPHLYLPLKKEILSKLPNQTIIDHEQNV